MTRSRHLSTYVPESNFKLEKGKPRRRSLSDMFGIRWQPLKTNTFQEHSNQAASRTLIGAGYSRNLNSIQENGLNNTTLQTAILTLVEDLNHSSETINYVKEELTKPCAIAPMKENISKGKGKSLDKEEMTKRNNHSFYLTMKGCKKNLLKHLGICQVHLCLSFQKVMCSVKFW
jgi:hypothetical protein